MLLFHHFQHQLPHHSRILSNLNLSSLKCSHLINCSSLALSYYRSCMPHSAAWRCSLPGDEAYHGQVAIIVDLQPFCSLFLGITPDLTYHQDSFSFLVLHETFQNIDKRGANEGITTNSNNSRLAKPNFGRLKDCFIG